MSSLLKKELEKGDEKRLLLPEKLREKNGMVLVSDLDWTMVNHNDTFHDDLLEFNNYWMKEMARDSLLIFSSGRSPTLYAKLALDVPLLKPDILVCSVGTEILVDGTPDQAWEAYLDEGWDRESVVAVVNRFPELVLQQASEQRPHKVSYKLYAADPQQAQGVVSNLRAQLTGAGIKANVIFSGGEDLDVLPSRASKGKALSFLLEQLAEHNGGKAPERGVLVCGDSGNDVELFEVPHVHGCVVANAHPELREWYEENKGNPKMHVSEREGPAGILETIKHFGLAGDSDIDVLRRRSLVIDTHVLFEKYFNDLGGEEIDMSRLGVLFGDEFELISPGGDMRSKKDLLRWFETTARGIYKSSLFGEEEGASMYRIWIDGYSEKEVSPGTWLVRYYEAQQRFPDVDNERKRRKLRISSALLRKCEDSYVWSYVHETWSTVFPSVDTASGGVD